MPAVGRPFSPGAHAEDARYPQAPDAGVVARRPHAAEGPSAVAQLRLEHRINRRNGRATRPKSCAKGRLAERRIARCCRLCSRRLDPETAPLHARSEGHRLLCPEAVGQHPHEAHVLLRVDALDAFDGREIKVRHKGQARGLSAPPRPVAALLRSVSLAGPALAIAGELRSAQLDGFVQGQGRICVKRVQNRRQPPGRLLMGSACDVLHAVGMAEHAHDHFRCLLQDDAMHALLQTQDAAGSLWRSAVVQQ
mmetsp:Transcript_2912/g.11790  ORF Transcript_2912/g.11790 Transcript_2912/m.11790 type:complete len:251 (-) Transcript_2912:850-1602(-)